AFNIQSISGGFVVTLNPKNSNQIFPFDATLRVAYDTRGGNPFAKYRKFDFDLGSGAINITTAGCNLLGKGNNEIKVNVMGSNFRLEVLGFDPNRDLLVEIIES
ncbi:MAG: hypothetical protein NC902_06065, partial [Candidatus Omnitrophica bacterium]|nr:hypothetical protein [Candidatus Omnitrophota bacterium]